MGACVVGIPDYITGERIKAIVVLKEDVRDEERRKLEKGEKKVTV